MIIKISIVFSTLSLALGMDVEHSEKPEKALGRPWSKKSTHDHCKVDEQKVLEVQNKEISKPPKPEDRRHTRSTNRTVLPYNVFKVIRKSKYPEPPERIKQKIPDGLNLQQTQILPSSDNQDNGSIFTINGPENPRLDWSRLKNGLADLPPLCKKPVENLIEIELIKGPGPERFQTFLAKSKKYDSGEIEFDSAKLSQDDIQLSIFAYQNLKWRPSFLSFVGDFLGKNLSPLGQIKSLQTLYMNKTNLTADSLKFLGNLTNLTMLDLSENPLIGDEIGEFLKDLPSLQDLRLPKTGITEKFLSYLEFLPSLNALDLNFCKIHLTPQNLQKIPRNIVEFRVGDPIYDHFEEKDLENLEGFKGGGKILDCSNRLLSGQAFWEILVDRPEIQQFFYECSNLIKKRIFSDSFFAIICPKKIQVEFFPTLLQLDISYRGITDETLEGMTKIFPNLQIFYLSKNPDITDKSLKSLSKFQSLQELHLDGTTASPQKAFQLFESTTNLQEMHFDKNILLGGVKIPRNFVISEDEDSDTYVIERKTGKK